MSFCQQSIIPKCRFERHFPVELRPEYRPVDPYADDVKLVVSPQLGPVLRHRPAEVGVDGSLDVFVESSERTALP